MVDRLSSDDNGELLLQPIGYCKELVDGLAAVAIDEGLPLERRTDGARTLLGIAQKAADDTIVFVNARAVRLIRSSTNRGVYAWYHVGKSWLLKVNKM